jgi:hypothetical protein
MQYCGDETAALVGDLGSRSFKFGFAGEDVPKGWLPSCVGRGAGAAAGGKAPKRVRVGDSALGASSEDTEVVWARREGRVADWDAVEALWSHALGTVLSSDPREHPVLACTATYESAADRAKLAELLAETLQVPAFFLARNAMLSAFSLGRASALVLDVGAARSVCAPVQDGFVLARGVRTSGVAGDLVDDHLVRLLETQVLPHQLKAAPGQPVPIRVHALMTKRPAPESALVPQPAAWVVEDKPPERAVRVAAPYVDLQRRAVVQDLRETSAASGPSSGTRTRAPPSTPRSATSCRTARRSCSGPSASAPASCSCGQSLTAHLSQRRSRTRSSHSRFRCSSRRHSRACTWTCAATWCSRSSSSAAAHSCPERSSASPRSSRSSYHPRSSRVSSRRESSSAALAPLPAAAYWQR